jgi:lysozyme family protein
VTLAAVRERDPQALAANMLGQRLRFMTDLSTWQTFGKGWARRVADLLQGVT